MWHGARYHTKIVQKQSIDCLRKYTKRSYQKIEFLFRRLQSRKFMCRTGIRILLEDFISLHPQLLHCPKLHRLLRQVNYSFLLPSFASSNTPPLPSATFWIFAYRSQRVWTYNVWDLSILDLLLLHPLHLLLHNILASLLRTLDTHRVEVVLCQTLLLWLCEAFLIPFFGSQGKHSCILFWPVIWRQGCTYLHGRWDLYLILILRHQYLAFCQHMV